MSLKQKQLVQFVNILYEGMYDHGSNVDSLNVRQSAEEFYDRYASKLYKIVCCHVKTHDAAETVLEKVMLKIWNDIEAYDLQNEIMPRWMARLARSIAKQYTRDRYHP